MPSPLTILRRSGSIILTAALVCVFIVGLGVSFSIRAKITLEEEMRSQLATNAALAVELVDAKDIEALTQNPNGNPAVLTRVVERLQMIRDTVPHSRFV